MKPINVIGTSGSPNRMNLESVDRISLLPDSILGIILSFLPTKNAVSTAVLSKRWSLVWTMVRNLDLRYVNRPGEHDERDDMRFVGFVNRVLLHHDLGCLNKFCLEWSPMSISSHVTSWIDTAISKNVHELILHQSLYYKERTSLVPFVMPTSVFSSDTLRILELDGFISVSESTAFCLPKLETIMLESIHFQSEEAFDKFIRGCPMLIHLHISITEDTSNDDGFTYIISSTSLRHLEVVFMYPNDVPLYINLELEAPSLEYLSLYGFIPVFFGGKSLSSLIEANLDTDHLGDCHFSDVHMCNLIVEAVRVFSFAKALNLSAHTISALSFATIGLLTDFKRLVKLEASTYSCACSSLRDFIECSDNLEVLSVYQFDSSNDEILFDPSKWIAPVQVPRCLSNSLKKVKIENYYGRENEHEMVRYMLKHGKALEDMDISFDSDFGNTKLELVQEMCELSKELSSKCNIKVR